MAKTAQLTPMLRHYLEVKNQHQDAIVFYRMGDFFELFFEDAERAAPIMEVSLTARHKGTPNQVPMCGVPHHALERYLGKILKSGLKVAICDQVENPAEAKGLVRREVTRIVTPGTISSPELLDGKEENLLACVIWEAEAGAGAFLDVSTGSFFVRRFRDSEECLEQLAILRPREVLRELECLPVAVEKWLGSEVACLTVLEEDSLIDRRCAGDVLLEHFAAASLRGFGLEDKELAVIAAAAALAYARETQQSQLQHVKSLAVREAAEAMVLDATTLANLEIFRNQREGSRKATLLSVLDRTCSPPGGRLLRDWLRRPLCDPKRISERHDAVSELTSNSTLRQDLRAWLATVGDAERQLSRAVFGSMTPREAAALRDGLRVAPEILAATGSCQAPLLQELAAVDPLPGLAAELDRMLMEEPPTTFKNGGVIAEGVDEELDRCRDMARNSKQHILALEAEERERTGISSLKIRYNKVFGYYLEVTKANQHLVPDHYIRKQTLVAAERYVTPEVKELEEQVLGAEERQLALEEQYFQGLLDRISEEGVGLRALAAAIAAIDVLASFAEQAARRSYCRPFVRAMGEPISIQDGRHPVVEATATEPFVPNDVDLDNENSQIVC